MACDGYNNGSVFNVSVVGRWNNVSDIINSYQMYLVNGGPLDIDDVSESLRDVFDQLYDYVKLFCNVVTVWSGIKIAELDGDCATGLVAFASPITGSLSNDPTPSGVAALASFPTGIKRRVLRKYFGGLDESIIGPSGNISTAGTGLVQDAVDFLLTDMVGVGITWRYVYRSTIDGVPTNVFPRSGKANSIPAYQRRRRLGTGN